MSTPRTNQDFRFSDCSDEKYHKVIDKIYSLVNFEHSDIGKSRDCLLYTSPSPRD